MALRSPRMDTPDRHNGQKDVTLWPFVS